MGNSNHKPEKKNNKGKKEKGKRKNEKIKDETNEKEAIEEPTLNEEKGSCTDTKPNEDNQIVKGKEGEKEEYIELYNEGKKKVTQDDFELLKVIGRGSFGKVMMVRKKDDGRIFAMKILRKDIVKERKQVDHTKAEKNVLMQLHHPFIVKLYYAFQTADKLYMVMDFVNGGELFYHLKNENCFSEE
ncbi:cAMP-dependent protein kinase, gamma-catalytic subunit, putative, partial [Entamoeba dispar SAW760]